MLGLAGAFGGAVRSFLGYNAQAGKKEAFDKLKLAKSIVRATVFGFIAGMALPLGTDFVTAMGIAAGVGIGGDVLLKESVSTVSKLKK